MGQYYVPTLIDCNGKMKTFYSHDYNNGLKLTEHSFIGNIFVAAVLHELVENPHRVYWLGDYAKIDDFKNKEYRLFAKERKRAWSDRLSIPPTDDNIKWDFDNAFIANLDNGYYIKLSPHNNQYQFCPLCLLTAVGNGRGGGDYRGINMGDVGCWAGNEIYVTYDKPEDMIDVTKDYWFVESWMLKEE